MANRTYSTVFKILSHLHQGMHFSLLKYFKANSRCLTLALCLNSKDLDIHPKPWMPLLYYCNLHSSLVESMNYSMSKLLHWLKSLFVLDLLSHDPNKVYVL